MINNFILFYFLFLPFNLSAAQDGSNYYAGIIFSLFVVTTLIITYFASKKTVSKDSFYAAGGKISGLQNGLAVAGYYMSAGSFLGVSGLV